MRVPQCCIWNNYLQTSIFYLAVSSAIYAQALTLYVSPAGHDDYPGTIEQPLATVSRALELTYDDTALYVSVSASMFASTGINSNAVWGVGDGVEISIQGASESGESTVFVLRGYVDGTLQSVTVAGASPASAAQLEKSVSYAVAPGAGANSWQPFDWGWNGEFAIPFQALGIKPESGKDIPFNMVFYYSESGQWRYWEGTHKVEAWNLAEGGRLLFK